MTPCCLCDLDGHTGPQEQTKWYPGEVFEIQESVFTPIECILADARASGLTGRALRRSQSSLHSMRTREHATRKRRPCVLMNFIRQAYPGMVNSHICLMCTFEKTPIDELPRIFRYFCVQVYTECAGVLEHPHLHSVPEWPLYGDTQWVILRPFRTTRGLLGRWRAPGGGCGPTRKGMAFGKGAMAQLQALCAEKDKEWKSFCETQGDFAAEYEQEYREYLKIRKSSMGSRTASRASRDSAAPSQWRGHDRQSVMSHTIFEDKVSVFQEKVIQVVDEHESCAPAQLHKKHARRGSRGAHRKSNACSLASVGEDGVSLAPSCQRSPVHNTFSQFARRAFHQKKNSVGSA